MQPTPSFSLSVQERALLEELITPLELTTEVRRAHALLWIDAGHSPQTIARRLHVSRQTIYNWIATFQRRGNLTSIQARLTDRPRSGRPRTLACVIDPLIAAAISHTPDTFGYPASVWNTSLLRRYLREAHHLAVTRASVTVALRRLGIRLKVITLRPHEREELKKFVTQTASTKERRHAQALLWLDEGVSVRKIAVQLRTSRQTVYNWIAQFQAWRSEHELSAGSAKDSHEGLPQTPSPGENPFPTGALEHQP